MINIININKYSINNNFFSRIYIILLYYIIILLFYYYYYLKLYYIIYNYKISLTCNLDLVFSSLFQIVLDD